jgi:hypothetical protein
MIDELEKRIRRKLWSHKGGVISAFRLEGFRKGTKYLGQGR